MIESEHEARVRDQEWELAQEKETFIGIDPASKDGNGDKSIKVVMRRNTNGELTIISMEELSTASGGCTCEKFDDGSGGLTVKPH